MKNLSSFVNEANDLHIDLDIPTLVSMLEDALAEEFNAWYAYTIVQPYMEGNERTEAVELFKTNGKDELEDHAYWLMERINQLDSNPKRLMIPSWDSVATHKYITPNSFKVKDLLEQNIEAEKGAIETYTKLEEFTRDKDIVTNTKIKEILTDEQEHLHGLKELLKDIKG